MDDRVLIFDTTLRDGEQSAGAAMTVEEKVEIAKQLDRLGVDIIEAGFPISSPGDFDAVQRIAREVRRPTIAALAHANIAAVDRAGEALKDADNGRIHVFISSSDQHIQHQLRKNREEVVEMATASVAPSASARGRCRVLAHGLEPDRQGVRGAYREGRRGRGGDDGEHPRHRWLRDPRGVCRPDHLPSRAGARVGPQRALVSALPRRPWHVGGEQPGCGEGGCRGRWRVASMASASALATPRSKRSSWPSGRGPTTSTSKARSTRRSCSRHLAW